MDKMVRLKATKENCNGASWDGRWYSSDQQNCILVPERAVPALTHFLHGFVVVDDSPAPARERLTLAKVRRVR